MPRTVPQGRNPTKERKVKSKVPNLVQVIQKAGHAYGEVDDAISAIHDALPKEYQAKRKRPDYMLKALYRHWDKLDVNQAIVNLLANHVEDAIVGRISGGAKEYASKHGITLGRTGIGVYGV